MLEGLQGLVEGSESSTNNGVFFGVGGITQRCLHTVNEIRTGLGVSGHLGTTRGCCDELFKPPRSQCLHGHFNFWSRVP